MLTRVTGSETDTGKMTSIEILVLLTAASLVVGLIGFFRTVWFISIGYAASIVVFVLIMAAVWPAKITALTGAQLDAASSLSAIRSLIAAIGIGVMWSGLAIEALADYQKSRLKSVNPGAFASGGLYRWVRYPNYLGEITFWFGNFIAGSVACATWWHWAMAMTGLVCIVLIMLGSTKRLEIKQDERYGSDPRYRAYARTVPVLFPWLPIYSLKNIRVYLE